MNIITKTCDDNCCTNNTTIPVLRDGVFPSCLPDKDEVDIYARENGILYYFDQYGEEHVVKGEGQITVIDNLNSEASDYALSAKQGNILDKRLKEIEDDSLSVESFGAVGDGITNDYTAIQNAIQAARSKRQIVLFKNPKYFIGDNTLNIYTSIRLGFLCETRFIFRLTTDKPALLYNVDLNSNSDPKITEPLLVGRGLYIEGDTTNRIGTAIGFNPTSSALQVSNLEVNNIKIQYFDRGLTLPAGNFYINRFRDLHITQCNTDIESNIANQNSGENINFDFCVLGSAKIGLKSNGGVTGYWFNNCSLDFLQCLYNCNENRGQDMVTFRDCWIEGFNANQGGDPTIHGLVYGNSYVAASNPHPNRVSFLDCKIVNNSKTASIGSVSDIIIENTDAEILMDNIVLSTASVYDESSYEPNKLYGCNDSVNIKVTNFRIALRPQGNKLIHKTQNLLPVHITRSELIDLTSANSNNSYSFGNVRVRGFSNLNLVHGLSGSYLDIVKTDSALTANCIIEPNIDLIDIKHLKDLMLFPSINVQIANVNSIGLHYLIRYYNKDGNLASSSSSFKNFLFSDGVSAGIDNIIDFVVKDDFIPYAVRNYRWVDPSDIPEDAAYFLPCVRFQFTGEGAAEVRFNEFNIIDKKSELVLNPKEYYNTLPTSGNSFIGKNGFYGDIPTIYNGSRWLLLNDGITVESFGAKGDGTTNDYLAIQQAINLARTKHTYVTFLNNSYYLGDNILNLYNSVRLNFTCETKFKFALSTDKMALQFNVDLNSNTYPKINENLLIGRGLYVEGTSTNRIGTGLGFNPSSSTMQVSNLIINNIKIQYFGVGIKLPSANFYLNTFEGVHVTQCNNAVESNINSSNNAGENIVFEQCVFGSSQIAINLTSFSAGYTFNQCSFDFNQCVFFSEQGRNIVTLNQCHIEGTNWNRDGNTSIYGVIKGITEDPIRAVYTFNQPKFVNNHRTNTTSVGDLYFDTNAVITINGGETTFQNSNSIEYTRNPLYLNLSNTPIISNGHSFGTRIAGTKRFSKYNDIFPVNLLTKTVSLPAYTTPQNFGTVVTSLNASVNTITSTESDITVTNVITDPSGSITFEPNIELLPIDHIKNSEISILPIFNVTQVGANITNLLARRTIHQYDKNGNYLGLYLSSFSFRTTDSFYGSLKDMVGLGDIVASTVADNDIYELDSKAVYYRPGVRVEWTGADNIEFKFISFNAHSLFNTKPKFNKIIEDSIYTVTQNAKTNDTLYDLTLDLPVIKGRYKWLNYDGKAAGRRNGTEANKPTGLVTDDQGLMYYNSTTNRPNWWTGGIWREADSVGAGTLRLGTTAQRPTTAANYISGGFQYFDTTLFRGLVWTGSVWREIADGVAAGTSRNGTTAQRPIGSTNYLYTGFKYFDTTLGKVIFYAGSDKWIEGDGALAGVLRTGTTAQRPIAANIYIGFNYLDTTINKLIIWNGTKWIEEDGSNAGVARHGKLSDRADVADVADGFIFTYDDATGFSVKMGTVWVDILV